ncbi:MAG: hypothetical protein ACE5DI_01285 [Candidatus Micrarchaeia archaeon]
MVNESLNETVASMPTVSAEQLVQQASESPVGNWWADLAGGIGNFLADFLRQFGLDIHDVGALVLVVVLVSFYLRLDSISSLIKAALLLLAVFFAAKALGWITI